VLQRPLHEPGRQRVQVIHIGVAEAEVALDLLQVIGAGVRPHAIGGERLRRKGLSPV